MQKTLYIVLAAVMMMVSSCSMEVTPEGTISNKDALKSISDYQKFCIGLNAQMRSVTSGDYVILSDVQLDDFNAVVGNGNRRMEFYNGQVTPATGEIEGIYSGYYSAIAQINYFLQNGTERLKDDALVESDRKELSYYVATAYFFRAYCYSCMADKFCQSYKNCADRDKEGTGLSLQLVYAPTADSNKYPGRSSLSETYKQILSDLSSATALMNVAQGVNIVESDVNFPSLVAVNALSARVYLNMGMYKEASELAESVIGNDNYALIDNKREFHDMWFNDQGKEILWKVTGDYTYHGSSTGSAFCGNDKNPDYVPDNDAVWLFDENDVRWFAWFENDISENTVAKPKEIKDENSGAKATLYLFAKYPGNPIFRDKGVTASNFINMAKPLRLGEMYLIAAEAYAEMNNEKMAKKYLSELEDKRHAGGYSATLTGTALMDEIRNERHRELMGEGLRQADLKRWNIGCTRSDAFDGLNDVIISNFRNLHYEAGDYRLTWPIPQHEMDTNPQLAGQQNPGY